jgi:hypothetical protein
VHAGRPMEGEAQQALDAGLERRRGRPWLPCSTAAARAAAFYREAADARSVWTIRDAGGCPAPVGTSGARAQPFWSSRSRAERIVQNVPAYPGFEVEEIAWSVFCERWAPGLESTDEQTDAS